MYGINLAATLGTPALTWRRYETLLGRLPVASEFARDVHGEAALWTVTDYLLASLIDVGQAANWQRGGGKSARPTPFPRPTSKKASRKNVLEGEELRRRLAAFEIRARERQRRLAEGGGDV